MEREVHEAGVADIVEAHQSQSLTSHLLFVSYVRITGGGLGGF